MSEETTQPGFIGKLFEEYVKSPPPEQDRLKRTIITATGKLDDTIHGGNLQLAEMLLPNDLSPEDRALRLEELREFLKYVR